MVTVTDNVQVNFELWDDDGTVGDSAALVDNVAFKSVVEDFDSGIGAFNPDTGVSVVGQKLRRDEDFGAYPTYTYRDNTNDDGPVLLTFDVDWLSTDVTGSDFFRLTLLDLNNAGPFASIPDLDGFGSILEIPAFTGDPYDTAGPFVSVVPLPTSGLLCALGMETPRFLFRRK